MPLIQTLRRWGFPLDLAPITPLPGRVPPFQRRPFSIRNQWGPHQPHPVNVCLALPSQRSAGKPRGSPAAARQSWMDNLSTMLTTSDIIIFLANQSPCRGSESGPNEPRKIPFFFLPAAESNREPKTQYLSHVDLPPAEKKQSPPTSTRPPTPMRDGQDVIFPTRNTKKNPIWTREICKKPINIYTPIKARSVS